MNKNKLLVILAITANFTACTTKQENKAEEGKFIITSPVVMDTSFAKEYVAQIQSLQNVEIHAMVKGYLESINVDEGQQVKAGQVLFNIRPIEFQSELLKAKAEAKETELELQNVRTLAEKNIVSQTELAVAIAKLDQKKAEVALAELNLSYTEIKAPFDGIIDRIRFKAGSRIDEGTLLTTISNNKDVFAYFNFSENEYLHYKEQTKNGEKESANLLLANGQLHKYPGTVETVESEFDNNTGNISFRAKFPNPDLLLKHGETGKVQLVVRLKNALIIPQKATYEIQDKIFVYVIDQNNVVRSRAITIKQRLPNLYIIDSGITEKDKILLEGLQSAKEDDKIEAEYVDAKNVINNLQLIKKVKKI